MQTSQPKVSLCMIVKNEEANLPACLESVKGLFDEIIIVDTGSTDRTKEIALQYGAIVSDFEWIDDFSAARNKSIKLAKGQWIFWLNADNRVAGDNYTRLKDLLAKIGDENIGYNFPAVSLPSSLEFPQAVYHLRLFRNDPKIRWINRTHEQIIPSLIEAKQQIQYVDIPIDDHGYNDPELQKKLERNLQLLEREAAFTISSQEATRQFNTLYDLARTYRKLKRYKEALLILQQTAIKVEDKSSNENKLLMIELIENYQAINSWKDALIVCQQAQRWLPQTAVFLIYESQALEKLSNIDRAIERLLQLCSSEATLKANELSLINEAHYKLGVYYHIKNNFEEAEKHLVTAIKQNPTHGRAWIELTRVWISQEQWEKALGVCLKAKTLLPDYIDPYFWESLIYDQLGKHSKAQEILLNVIENYKNFKSFSTEIDLAMLHHNLGVYYSNQDEYSLAEKHWSLAVKEIPRLIPSWFSLIKLWIQHGQWERITQAATYLETIVHYNEMATVIRAKLLDAQGKTPEALSLLKECITNHPEMIWPKIILGEISINASQELQYAEKTLLDVLTIDPNNALAKQLISKMPEGIQSMHLQQPKVSLCMIVKNEEANLPACLESVKGLFDEIIIVDTGSTDRTKEIALQYGAIVSDFEWIDDFSAARNKSIELATGKWIFWLDADNRVDKDNYNRLKDLFKQIEYENTGYKFPEISASPLTLFPTTVYYARLFHNDPKIRWRYRIHEQITPSLIEVNHQIQTIDIDIEHVGYNDAAELHRKVTRNLQLLEKEKTEVKDIPTLAHNFYHLSLTYHALKRYDEALSLIQQAIDITPADDFYYLRLYPELMRVQDTLGHWDEALKACEKAKELRPTDWDLLFRESQIWDKKGNFVKAEACLLKLLNFPLYNKPLYLQGILHRLGTLYKKHKQYIAAEKLWNEAIQINPHFSLAWQSLADLWISQHQWDRLANAIEKIETQIGDKELAATLKTKMNEAQKNISQPQPSTESLNKLQQPTVSLCMIVKDEEANLPACLESVKGLFSEIIIVDTGSTDRTKEIALQYGAIVSDFEWIDDFSAARNKSLELATGQWIFWLDADHRLDKENYHQLKLLFESLKDEKIAFSFNERLYYPSSTFPIYNESTRLFRNHPQVRWEYRIHEQLPRLKELGYQLRASDIIIPHFGYEDPEMYQKKRIRDYYLLEKERADIPKNKALLPHAYFHLSRHYRGMKQPTEALPLLKYALNVTPKNDVYYNSLSIELMRVYQDLEQWQNALNACKQAQALMPSSGKLIFEESRILEKLGHLDRAIERLLDLCSPHENLRIEDPSLLDKAHYNLAIYLHKQNKLQEAEKHLMSIVAHNPELGMAWLELAMLYSSQMRLTEALSASQKAKTLMPDSLPVYFWESWIHLQLGNYSQAQILLLQLIKNYPSLNNKSSEIDLAKIYHNLAVTYDKLNDPIQAEKNWQMAVKENPKLAHSWIALIYSWTQRAQWEMLSQAMTYLERTVHYDEMAIVIKAKLFAAQGKNLEAISLLKECIINHPEMTWPKIILGEISINASQELPYAEKVLQEVLAIDPNNDFAKQLLNKMPRLR